ncbi:hypothetical protein BASA81_002557 [Batrachochytrium salamandrivorans]|nr:hypothetical protein BASA81_002557 [Batrachochytrium salamandrivorans]
MSIANQLGVLTARRVLRPDSRQLELAKRLDRLSALSTTFHHHKQIYVLQSRHDLLLPQGVQSKYTPPRIPRGLFITGKVGTGKSMLMNLFLQGLTIPHTRVHFHGFLQEIHRQAFTLKQRGKSTHQVLQEYGEMLGRDNAVFALDEFLLPDSGSNTMLQPVLESLMKQTVVVATSNLTELPDYLPCKLFDMNQEQDYRNLVGGQAGQCQLTLQEFAERFPGFDSTTAHVVQVGRIADLQVMGNTAKCDFNKVFAAERFGVPDYLLVCQQFDTLVITNVPEFRLGKKSSTQFSRNAASRFFCFLDVAYEHGTKLVLVTNSANNSLFPEDKDREANDDDKVAAAAFKRARSRWMEMSQEEL